MTEIKVNCPCGQKYSFATEPINGQMPNTVNCPVCGADGTGIANSILAQQFASAPATAAPAAPAATGSLIPPVPAAGGLRINRPAAHAAPAAPAEVPVAAPIPQPAAAQRVKPLAAAAASQPRIGQYNMGMGILGAVLGAGLGSGLVYGFDTWVGFHMPLTGTAIGALSGLGARILYRGTDNTLGIIAAVVALAATAGTLHLIFGDIAGLFIITMIVSAIIGYRVAS